MHQRLLPQIFLAIALTALSISAVMASVEDDVLKHRLIQAIEHEDHSVVLDMIATLKKRDVKISDEIYYHKALAHFGLKQNAEGDKTLELYLQKMGKSGQFYDAAIALLSERMTKREAERKEAEQRAEAERRAAEQRAREEAERKRRIEEERRREAAFVASLKPIGTLSRINSEWNYGVVSLTGSAPAVGTTLYVTKANGRRVELKASRVNGKDLTVTGSAIKSGEVSAGETVQAQFR